MKQYGKIRKLNTTPQKANNAKIQQNKTTLVQLPFMTLGQETRWAYSTMLPSPHMALKHQEDIRKQTSMSSTIQSAG